MAVLKIDHRIQAASLFETIIALMVIVLVFGIGMTMYVNVLKNSNSLLELKAAQRLEEISRETVEKKSYFNESFEEEMFTVEKTVSVYKDVQGVLLLELTALRSDTIKLAEHKLIISEATDEKN